MGPPLDRGELGLVIEDEVGVAVDLLLNGDALVVVQHPAASIEAHAAGHSLRAIGDAVGVDREPDPLDHELVGAAVTAHVAVIPVASMSSPYSRTARAEVGPPVRLRKKRRGPLAEIEIAEAAQRHLQRVLDELGGMQTGMAAFDWLGEG